MTGAFRGSVPLLRALVGGVALLLIASARPASQASPTETLRLTPRRVTLSGRPPFEIDVPAGFDLTVVAQGLRRPRTLAISPDRRLFLTDLFSRADNSRGAVYVLEGFDPTTGRMSRLVPFLSRLRNPQSLAFHTDTSGETWLYLAMTDRLVRYRYRPGDRAPSSLPQVLATFPDYGLSYKYGGWHLTRTVAIGPNQKVYVSVGSSCNACEEREAVRASVIEMDLDGGHPRPYATGLRNAVGLRWLGGRLLATNMGADHLGDDRPSDTLFDLGGGGERGGLDFGWPWCYPIATRWSLDRSMSRAGSPADCAGRPPAVADFGAHSSPLGFDRFDAASAAPLRRSLLVALHGSSKLALRRGYRIVRVRDGHAPEDFIAGFQKGRVVHGRPADILRVGPDAFLFTDDHAGVVYYVSMANPAG